MDLIYLDNNATTPMLPAVLDAMRPYMTDSYGNPASAHQAGRRGRQALEDAREQIAAILGAYPDEVVFTSGGTEANNLALFGLAGELRALTQPGSPGHVIISSIEHPSVAEPILQLEKQGFTVDRLPVNRESVIDVDDGRVGEVFGTHLRALTQPGSPAEKLRLVSVMLVNNEVGSIQPIAELVQLLEGRAPFHCDAVQAAGRIPVHFHHLGVTTMAISAHKFHGPKGIGALLLRRDAKLLPRLFGGHQQQGRRPGTEPVALAVGMAAALDLWRREAHERADKVRGLREKFLHQLESSVPPVVLNGPRDSGLPHTLNLSFPGCQADSLLMNLDLAGVACSTGSACSSGSLLPSPALKAMHVEEEVLRSAMRFSLGHLLTEAQIIEAARRISAVVRRLREVPIEITPNFAAKAVT
ncbi:MAG TPA: cysteine desulfurase family protein [Gemmataceae bacterium]|jgi:cysteine desulfurase|nr:cysteine desulfurase family protein [Gemmataceae bacterium]